MQQARRAQGLNFLDIADDISRRIEGMGDAVTGALFEPVVRLGVTGLSRAGKTVFITSLVANLLDRDRMPGLRAAAEGRIVAAYLQPQPDDTVPRFDFESHLAAMTGPTPHWPESTRAISQLRLSLRVRPAGFLAGLPGPRTVHLDIVDYPGEWLMDLALLDQSYQSWAQDTLSRLHKRADAQGFMERARAADPDAPHDETLAQDLARRFTCYLGRARDSGAYDCIPPGRFLLPGDLEGSPVLTFAPIPVASPSRRGTLHREMERRFESYKAKVVKPFFRDHLSRIDRQVVLIDALQAIHDGPAAVEDLRRTMADILTVFRPGANTALARLLRGRRVDRILFAATRADHLHHDQHPRLRAIMQALARDARDRAEFAGARTEAMAIAALRATVEDSIAHDGQRLNCVRGVLQGGTRRVALYPGELPEDPAQLLSPARSGAERWLDAQYDVMRFAPAPLSLKPGDGPPHIRLDRAAEFLIGDKL
jgi:predicted YcjX-like family ATPase